MQLFHHIRFAYPYPAPQVIYQSCGFMLSRGHESQVNWNPMVTVYRTEERGLCANGIKRGLRRSWDPSLTPMPIAQAMLSHPAGGEEEKSSDLSQYFPLFLWVLRDFHLRLADEPLGRQESVAYTASVGFCVVSLLAPVSHAASRISGVCGKLDRCPLPPVIFPASVRIGLMTRSGAPISEKELWPGFLPLLPKVAGFGSAVFRMLAVLRGHGLNWVEDSALTGATPCASS